MNLVFGGTLKSQFFLSRPNSKQPSNYADWLSESKVLWMIGIVVRSPRER